MFPSHETQSRSTLPSPCKTAQRKKEWARLKQLVWTRWTFYVAQRLHKEEEEEEKDDENYNQRAQGQPERGG